MPAPATVEQFLTLVRQSGVVDLPRVEAYLGQAQAVAALPNEPKELADLWVAEGLLTRFQAEQFLKGKWRGFTLGKYQILERIGAGGMGVVYLGEHLLLRRRVAVKVLPVLLARDPWFVDHFYQEAAAVAALDHPNVVRIHDIDRSGNLHFLIMEYVDGANLQKIVDQHGPLDVLRATHYVRQAALGLQHVHEAGLVHRDVKPGNLLLSRQGVIKVLDMGLARFLSDSQTAAARQEDSKIMVGTDDYLAPEQIVDSDGVDTRADIYGLGATFYFLLTGAPPFADESQGYQKLIRHLARHPRPIQELCPELPEELAAVLTKMMAKNPWERYPTAAAAAEALTPWTQAPIPPPSADEMPQLSPAARRSGPVSLPVGSPGPAENSSVVSWITQEGTTASGLVPNLAKQGSPGPSPLSPLPPRKDNGLAATAGSAPHARVAETTFELESRVLRANHEVD